MRKVTFLLGLAALLVCTSGASAFFDNFESYANQAAFEAAWPSWATNNSSMQLLNGFADSGVQSVSGVASTNNESWNFRNLESGLQRVATDAAPIVFSFDLYESDPAISGARNMNVLWAFTHNGVPAGMMPKYNTNVSDATWSKAGLIAMGAYNSPAPATTYHARIGFTWYDLGVARTAGWHEMKAVIKTSTVDVYVDGVLAPGGTAKPIGALTWSGVVLGSGLTSVGYDMPFDDISVTPEPATMLLLAAGGLLLRRRRTA